MLHTRHMAHTGIGCTTDSHTAACPLSATVPARRCSQHSQNAATYANNPETRRRSPKRRTTGTALQATAKQATPKAQAVGRVYKSINKLSGYLTVFTRVLMNSECIICCDPGAREAECTLTCTQSAGVLEGSASSPLRTLHAPGRPIQTGNLKVSDVHTVYYEVYGNPDGQPALVVHGGPGAGCYAKHA